VLVSRPWRWELTARRLAEKEADNRYVTAAENVRRTMEIKALQVEEFKVVPARCCPPRYGIPITSRHVDLEHVPVTVRAMGLADIA
jgi:hypothetical protein